MNKCPLSGLPCYHQKCIHITEVGPNYTLAGLQDLCILCGIGQVEGTSGLPQANSLFDLVGFILQDKDIAVGEIKLEPISMPSCPSCGYRIEDILTTGRLGCAECYNVFKEQIQVIIAKAQAGATQHKGKVPVNKESIAELELKLNDAIKAEDYIKAAELRDRIKKLKSQ